MEIVAHRAGNTPQAAEIAEPHVDMIELDVHVHRGHVEVRHAKVLWPTNRLWEKWYLLPTTARGVAIEEVLNALSPATPLMIDLKCFTRRAARAALNTLAPETPVVASTRSWWVLAPFKSRPNTRVLHSCGTRWQLWWALHLTRFGADHGVCVHESRLTPDVLVALQSRTPIVFSWGTTTAVRSSELKAAGLTGIILDDYSLAAD